MHRTKVLPDMNSNTCYHAHFRESFLKPEELPLNCPFASAIDTLSKSFILLRVRNFTFQSKFIHCQFMPITCANIYLAKLFPWRLFLRHIYIVTHPFSSFAFLSQPKLPHNIYSLFPDEPCNSFCTCSSLHQKGCTYLDC